MDSDSPWEEDPREDHIPQAEWSKITSEFTNTGYREGIIAGKEAFLQAGFDAGFAEVGAPIGRELGSLRGVAAAIRSFLIARNSDSPELEQEIRNISSMLAAIQFGDIAPPDLEAEQHAKEHLDADDAAAVEHATSETQREKRSLEDVAKLKEKLNLLCAKLGLPALP